MNFPNPNAIIAFVLVLLFLNEIRRAWIRDRDANRKADFDRLGHCCNKFRLAISPTDDREDPAIEFDAGDKSYDVPGCCGGGCYVLQDLDFCPWCGFKLRPQA